MAFVIDTLNCICKGLFFKLSFLKNIKIVIFLFHQNKKGHFGNHLLFPPDVKKLNTDCQTHFWKYVLTNLFFFFGFLHYTLLHLLVGWKLAYLMSQPRKRIRQTVFRLKTCPQCTSNPVGKIRILDFYHFQLCPSLWKMGGKVCFRCKGKTLLGIVNKLFVFKSLLSTPSNVLPLYLSRP